MKKYKISIGTIILAVCLLGMLVFVIWGAGAAWRLGGNTPMSIHGYIMPSASPWC